MFEKMRSYFVFIAVSMLVTSVGFSQVIYPGTHGEWCGFSSSTDYLPVAHAKQNSDYLTDLRVNPLVVREGIEPFYIEISVRDSSIESAEMTLYFLDTDLTQSANQVLLTDDGTNGDRIAKDGVFTSPALYPLTQEAPAYEWSLGNVSMRFLFEDGREESSIELLPGAIRIIDPAEVPVHDILQLEDDVFISKRAVNVVATEIYDDFPGQFFGFSDEDSAFPIRGAYKRLYASLPDAFDFITHGRLIGHFSPTRAIGASFNLVQEDVSGISGNFGIDSTPDYGSDGRLMGISTVYFGANTFRIYNHELLHRWAVGTDRSLGLGSAHWLPVKRPSTCFGTRGPSSTLFFGNNTTERITHVPDTTFTLDSGGVLTTDETHYQLTYDGLTGRCSDLELYLMGLIPPDSVESPITVLAIPGFIGQVSSPNFFSIFRADSLRQVSMDEIIQVMGPREPDYTASQKHFTSAYLLVYDRPLNHIEMAYYDFLMGEYEKEKSTLGITFKEVTGGRATLETTLPQLQGNAVPRVINKIDNVELDVGGDPLVIDLNTVFTDPDGGTLSYAFTQTDSAVAGIGITGNALSLTGLNPGKTHVDVTALDTQGGIGRTSFRIDVLGAVSIENESNERLPIALYQNYPNPFRDRTSIAFTVDRPKQVRLVIYNHLGQEVARLVDGYVAEGQHRVEWNTNGIASGVYTYRLITGALQITRRLVVNR